MNLSLTGPPEEAKQFVEATAIPSFYHVMNGQHIAYDDYVKAIATKRAEIGDYKPNLYVHSPPLFYHLKQDY